MRRSYHASLATIALACGGVVSIARAAPVIATDSQTGASPFTPTYTVSASDLLTGLTPTDQTGNFQQESAGGTPVLTDGANTGTIDRSQANLIRNAVFATAGNTGGTTLTYTLPSASNVTSIVVYGGWQDRGRDQQGYDLLYSTAADPATFLPITSVNFNPTIAVATDPVATRVTITDNAGNLASNVAAIRFNFLTVENGYTGYSEIDVLGSAVPEPASLGLLGLGALGLLARRRRIA